MPASPFVSAMDASMLPAAGLVRGENGAPAHASSGCGMVDLFFKLTRDLDTSSLARQKAMSNEDIALLAAGGLPVNNKYTNLAIAAKYANAHKGILLEREKAHLAELGFNLDHQYEVTFLVGQMTANNMVFASLINEGAPVEDGLKKMGPFKDTVYKSLKEEM